MKSMLKTLVAGALLVPALGFAAESGLNYNYLEAGYASLDPDTGSSNLDGWNLKGSLAIAPMWHLLADYSQFDVSGSGSDLKSYRVGGGIHYGLNPTVDLVGNVAWVRSEVGSFDDDGINVEALLRGQALPNVELEGGVSYVDFGGNNGDTTSFVGAARYAFAPAFAAGVSVAVNDDANTYGLNFRWNFK